MPKLTFLGAAGTVTGSKYLVEAAGKRLLIDCGIFQGTPELSDRNYKPLPTDPKTFDYAVLTHAISITPAGFPASSATDTAAPFSPIPHHRSHRSPPQRLRPSTRRRRRARAHKRLQPPRKPATSLHCRGRRSRFPLHESHARSGGFDISPEFHIESYDAGHILGSSSLVLTITENGKKTVVVFSGDIGRYDQPILNDPTTPPVNADVLLCESTYGDRDHEAGDPAELLAAVVNRVAKRGAPSSFPPSPSVARKPSCITCASSKTSSASRAFPSTSTAPWPSARRIYT